MHLFSSDAWAVGVQSVHGYENALFEKWRADTLITTHNHGEMSPLGKTQGSWRSQALGLAGPARMAAVLLEFGQREQVVHQQSQVDVQGLWLFFPGRGPPDEVGGILVPEKSPLGGLHGVEVV